MNLKKTIMATLTLVTLSGLSAQEKSRDEHLKSLSAGNDAEKISACKYLGNTKKDKVSIPEIISTLKTTDNPRVSIACSVALGYIAQKGESTTALKDKIMNTDNTDVVYSALLSIYNISIQNKTMEDDAKSAYEYAKTHHAHDEFIADAIAKIEKKKDGK